MSYSKPQEAAHVNKEILDFIKGHDLFTGLSMSQLRQLSGEIKEIKLDSDFFIIHEHDVADEIYIIKEGEVEITKVDAETHISHHLETLRTNAVIGEMSLIENVPRSASVRTTQPTVLLALSIRTLRTLAPSKNIFSKLMPRLVKQSKEESPIYSAIIKNVAKHLSQRLRMTNNTVIEALKHELIETKTRARLGEFLINVLILLSLYIFLIRAVVLWKSALISTTLISVPLILFFALPLIYMMRHSGHPLSFYGLTLKNWKHAVMESLLFSLPIFFLIVLGKWILIQVSPEYALSHHLFDLTLNLTLEKTNTPMWVTFLFPVFYFIFVPIQELIVRGALQTSFQELLVGPYKTVWAIILSNLLFSATHVYISLEFGLIVFLPGLFWGWLYSRQHTLIGVTLSHLLIGAWAIFIVGLF